MITKIKKLFSAGLLCCAMVAVLTACNKDNTSDMKLDGACLVEELVLNGQYRATVSVEKKLLKVKVPVDFTAKDNMEITSLRLSAGATANYKVGDHLNLDGSKTLKVTNGNLVMDYQLSVRNDEAIMTNFLLEGVKGAINQDDKSITVSVTGNSGIDLANATFEVQCSEDAVCTPASGTKADFTEPFQIVLTDNTATTTYTVYVTMISNPVALFVGEAENIEMLNPEEKAAAKWLTGNINGFKDAEPKAMAAVSMMKELWKRGVGFVLQRSAVNYAIALGAQPEDSYPNNVWGTDGEGSDLMGADPWTYRVFDIAHPLWQGLTRSPGLGDDRIITLDEGYTICNTTSQFGFWGDYPNEAAVEARTGGRALGGDGNVSSWELKSAQGTYGKGGIICFGTGVFDWNSPTPYEPKYHDNMGRIMLNAYNYLTK